MLNSFWWGCQREGHRVTHWQRWEILCVRKEERGLGFHTSILSLLSLQDNLVLCKFFSVLWAI